jgi:hypothetical protein
MGHIDEKILKKITKRQFLKFFSVVVFISILASFFLPVLKTFKEIVHYILCSIAPFSKLKSENIEDNLSKNKKEPIIQDAFSEIHISKGGSPEENIKKVIENMGGITNFIKGDDIVIIKPNAQWWNQGRTNLAAIKGFIDLVLDIPHFKGEIIIAENQHFMDQSLPSGEKDNVRGWTHFSDINGYIEGEKHNLNTLISIYKKQGYKNVTKSHWRDGGSKPEGAWGNGQNGGVVNSPADGDGYCWTDIDYVCSGLWGFKKWKVKLSYPIFTSKYSGVTIDFKEGAFKRNPDGKASFLPEKKIRFINFAVLNTHGSNTGITSAVKNYMGITDLSCGEPGFEPEGFVNVHACGGTLYPYGKAGPIGYFMKMIRKADLNIVTAEWVGWGDRINIENATQLQTILASTDPIALDYYGAKYLLFPLSRNSDYHDPDKKDSSVRKFLELALEASGEGTLDEKRMKVFEYDFKSHRKNL